MTDSEQLPVLVVGAGPAGLALATELRRGGVRCRIVDRAVDRPVHQARALTLWTGALDVLARHGIADAVTAQGLPLAASRYWSGTKVVATVRFGDGGPVPICIPQPDVERVQRANLADRGDTEVEWRTTLVGLRRHTDGVEVRLDGPAGPEQVDAAWVVGCDGAHSTVRDLAGIGFTGRTYPRTYVLGDGDFAGDAPRDEVHYTLHPDGVLVVVPLPGGGTRVFADATGAGGDPAAPFTPDQLQALVDRRAPYRLTVGGLRWSTRFEVHQRRAEAYRTGRVLLAGDAAHIHSPAGGQGMNTGIQDAANLGWKLALLLRGVSGADRLLDSYPAERAPVAAGVLRSSHQQTRMWGVRSPLGRGVRDAVLGRLGRSGVLEKRIVPMLAQDDLDYRSSPAVGGRGGRRALGDRVPDVPVGPVGATLGALLRAEPRHVLLLWPGDDLDGARAAVAATAPLEDRLRVLVLLDHPVDDLPGAVVPGHAPGADLAGCRSVLVRPDGYVADARPDLDVEPLLRDLAPTHSIVQHYT